MSNRTSLKYLNSVRALGVILVIVYHFFPTFLPGGFIGVDVFFVVSGYLITSLLIREYEHTRTIRLGEFYRRRFRRLFPAIVAMLLFSLPLSLLVSPDFRVDLPRQVAATLAWCTNYYEVFTGQSYEAQLLPHLFIHTWTLAIEMQYYLIWGAVITVMTLVLKLLKLRQLRPWILIASLLTGVCSFLMMRQLAESATDPTVAYLSTQSHIFPLMVGSCLACLAGFRVQLHVSALNKIRGAKTALTLTASILVVWLVVVAFTASFQDKDVYQYGLLVVSLATAGLLHCAHFKQESSIKLEWAITNYIGLRSYSIYLIHWPIAVILPVLLVPIGVPSIISGIVGIALTFLISEISYRFIEKPFRVGQKSILQWSRFKRAIKERTVFSTISISVAAVLVVFSSVACINTPRITSIERDLNTGEVELSKMVVDDFVNSLTPATQNSPTPRSTQNPTAEETNE